jgi:hypothetical protein
MHTIVVSATDPVHTEFLSLVVEDVVVEINGRRHTVLCSFTQTSGPENECVFEIDLDAELAGRPSEAVASASIVDIYFSVWPNIGFPSVSFRELDINVELDGELLT